jgi:hypothetical protein
LVLAAFAVVSTHSSRSVDVVKIVAEYLSPDEKHVVPIPLSEIRIGKRVVFFYNSKI